MIKLLIDTHCHLDSKDYENVDTVILNMGDNIIIASGTNYTSNLEVISLCKKYANVFGTIGIHPECVDEDIGLSLDFIKQNINNPKIVGIGEIGLDYHYEGYNKTKQIDVFTKQLELAKCYNKTVVVHSRDSINDTYELLKKYSSLKKVIHCFSSSVEMAEKFIKINSMIGIGGVLTFKNSLKIREIVEKIDLKYLLLETDSPYLAPEPLRGTKNEPSNVLLVAKKISDIKGISLKTVEDATLMNAVRQFDLNLSL